MKTTTIAFNSAFPNLRLLGIGITMAHEQEWITPQNSEEILSTQVMNSHQATLPRPPPPTRRPHHGVDVAADGALITTFICWLEPALVLVGLLANICVIVGMLRLDKGSGVGRYVL